MPKALGILAFLPKLQNNQAQHVFEWRELSGTQIGLLVSGGRLRTCVSLLPPLV
jgi:hypothetical protein